MTDAELLNQIQGCLETHPNRWTNDSRVQVKSDMGPDFWVLMSEVYYRTPSQSDASAKHG